LSTFAFGRSLGHLLLLVYYCKTPSSGRQSNQRAFSGLKDCVFMHHLQMKDTRHALLFHGK